MFSTKLKGPRMEARGTPVLTGYSCEGFLSRITWSCLSLKDDKIRLNTWPESPWDLSFQRKLGCQAFSISTAAAPVILHILKAQAALSGSTVRWPEAE